MHLLIGTFVLLVVSFMIFGASVGSKRVPIVFFPKGDPNFIYVYLKLPVGTDVEYTDSITNNLEQRVTKVLLSAWTMGRIIRLLKARDLQRSRWSRRSFERRPQHQT